jgi:hypothetical protein
MIVNTSQSPSYGVNEPARLADARPLYIAPSAETRVELDGPALCVIREGKADQLFPVQRISRVLTAQRVDWTSEALLACARMGIAVLFVDDDGQVVARVLGRPGMRDELHDRLTEFLLLPQAEGMYRFWVGNMRRRAAFWAGLKLGIPPEQRDPRSCRNRINRLAARYAGRDGAERSGQWLRALAYHWMQSHLQDLGFGSDNELGLSGEPALARDLTEVLMWYLEPVRVGWLKARYLAARTKRERLRPPLQREVVCLFESRTARAAARGREITSSLHRWLIHET